MKKIIYFFSLVSISFYSYGQGLTAVQSLPKEISPSSTFIIETTINKGALSGFIKLAQVLPEGFKAEDIDSKEGSFTFSEDGVKIIWMTPPTVETFKISYKVTVPSRVSGSVIITGKISYIDGNERKIVDFPEHTLTISSMAVINEVATLKKEEKPIEPVKVEVVKPVVEIVKAEEPVKVEVVRKEEPIKNLKVEPEKAPDNAKVPTTAVVSAPGKTYKVQIGAFSAKPKIEGVPEISTFVLDNGITKYFSGNFTNYEDAVKRKKAVGEKGFSGAFIVSFQDGKIVK